MIRSAIITTLALMIASSGYASEKTQLIRTLVIVSDKFVELAGSSSAAQNRVSQEIAGINQSLTRQSAGVALDVAGFEQVNLIKEFDPHELCSELTDFLSNPEETSDRFAAVPSLREKHRADLVIFMLNSKSGFLAESMSYGVACAAEYDEDGSNPRDKSYVFVDQLGLKTLTMAHEVGHFLRGDGTHDFANPKAGFATLMIANGNRQGLKRIPYWSDPSFSLDGKPLVPNAGVPDIEAIKKNIPFVKDNFTRWMQIRKR